MDTTFTDPCKHIDILIENTIDGTFNIKKYKCSKCGVISCMTLNLNIYKTHY